MDWWGEQSLGSQVMQWVYEPSVDHVLDVAENIREADELEVHLSHQMRGREAVIESWAYSDIVRGMATDDGVACGLCGVAGQGRAEAGPEEAKGGAGLMCSYISLSCLRRRM